MKTKFALALYIAAIIALVAMTGFIIWKLLIINPNVTDPWPVAGLAATIMGVAGTMLAILGAVAVAAWWTNLDKRIRDIVEELFDEQVKQRGNELFMQLAAYQVLLRKIDTVKMSADNSEQQLKKQISDVKARMEYLDRQAKAVHKYVLDKLIVDLPWEQLDKQKGQ